MELVVKKITPAMVEMNIDEVKNFITRVKEKYTDLVFSDEQITEAKDERAKLNKLVKNIGDIRKRIEKESKVEIENVITVLKGAEKEITDLSKNIDLQIKNFEEKEWELKQEEIKRIVNTIFDKNVDLKPYIVQNDKWKNKTFKLLDIEGEVQSQYEKLDKKYNFILGQLESANEEIENKIVFKSVEYLMNEEFDTIMKVLVTKKNEIKETEENIRKKAEEEAKRKLEEEQKKEAENNTPTIKKAIVEEVPLLNVGNSVEPTQPQPKQATYISIKVTGLSKEATQDLLEVIKKHKLEYIKEMR